MDQTIKSQWIAALRSGDYKQGRQVLKQDDTYCCLGVLCDLHSKAHPGDQHSWRRVRDQESCYKNCYRYAGMTTELPLEVQDWAGIAESDPVVIVDGKMMNLAALNDTGSTFAEIAQLIEEQL